MFEFDYFMREWRNENLRWVKSEVRLVIVKKNYLRVRIGFERWEGCVGWLISSLLSRCVCVLSEGFV